MVVGLPGAANVIECLGFRSMFSLHLYLGNKSLDSHINHRRHTVGLVLKCIVAIKEKKQVSGYNDELSQNNTVFMIK